MQESLNDDRVIAVASDVDLLHRLDDAFFRVGGARGSIGQYHGGEPQASEDDLRAVFEDTAEAWTLKEQRKAQEAHSGAIWLTARGLALSRVTPLPMD